MPFNVEAALKSGATEDQVLDYLRQFARGFSVDLALKSGTTRRQVIDYLAEHSGVNAEMAAKSGALSNVSKERPTLLSDPKGWWNSLTDDEKEQAVGTLGELAGGTVGGITAGPVGAGLGAVAGKNIAEVTGRAAGLKPTPKSTSDELLNQGMTFATNAMGEKLGRVAAPAVTQPVSTARAAAAAPGNAVRGALVSKEAPEIARLAREQGVTLKPGMVSKPLSLTEQALERFPTSRGVIQRSKQASQGEWEANLGRIAEGIHAGPADDLTVGRALGAKLEANQGAARQFYKDAYSKFGRTLQRAGVRNIELTPMKQSAIDLADNMPEGMWQYFPQKLQGWIKRAAMAGDEIVESPHHATAVAAGAGMDANMRSLDEVSQQLARGKHFGNLTAAERETVLTAARRGGIVPPDYVPGAAAPNAPEGVGRVAVPLEISWDEAQTLRTQLLEAERNIEVAKARGTAPAFDTRAIHALREGLDDSIENTLSSKSQPLADIWKDLRRKYRETATAIQPGSGIKGKGNFMAREIQTEVKPETLPRQATQSITPFRETQKAVGAPPNVPPPLETPDPTAALRRNYAERMVYGARTQDPMIGEGRYVNPRSLGRQMEDVGLRGGEEIIGPEAWQKYQEAQRIGKAFNPRDINTSGTALGYEMTREGRNIGRGAAALGTGVTAGLGVGTTAAFGGIPGAAAIGAGLTLPYGVAKGVTSPRVAQWLMQEPTKIGLRPGGPIAGAIGRIAENALENSDVIAPPPLESPEELERRKRLGI